MAHVVNLGGGRFALVDGGKRVSEHATRNEAVRAFEAYKAKQARPAKGTVDVRAYERSLAEAQFEQRRALAVKVKALLTKEVGEISAETLMQEIAPILANGPERRRRERDAHRRVKPAQ